jgi:hypothetical protein
MKENKISFRERNHNVDCLDAKISCRSDGSHARCAISDECDWEKYMQPISIGGISACSGKALGSKS